MAIPTYQECMLPILELLADGKQHTLRQFEDLIIEHFNISPAEQLQMLPSGQMPTFKSRVGWARTYLKKAGLIDSPKRATFEITKEGTDALALSPALIDVKFLNQYPKFQEFFKTSKSDSNNQTLSVPSSNGTPEEILEEAYQTIRNQLASDLLERVLASSPTFFESLVVELLVKMGYGGSRHDAGERVGQSGDGGIDGIIKEDRLGLDTIYIQAKRWQGTVGRPEVQKFVGALQGQRARKGVFITTSSYTLEASRYVETIDTKVVLVDGKKLSELMIDFGVGVNDMASYVIKRIDTDYFEDA